MIQLKDLTYAIGPRVLFEGLDWVLAPGDRCALVGPNGAGKTTLLRVILGEITPESGNRVMTRGTRLGYLPQEAAEKFEGTVLERAMDAHRGLIEGRAELDDLHHQLSTLAHDDPAMMDILERSGELQTWLEHHDEHTLEPRARQVLGGLGFSTADQDRPLEEFSGGWRMRAALAALLLTDPTLLFLDEPTNHLDLPAMEWLEDYLETFEGGLVVISHDRVFLDRVANEVMELDNGHLTPYPMRFSEYLVSREEKRDQMAADNVQINKRIAELSRFVERFGAKNTKAAQAASKKKMIARLETQRQVLPRRARSISFSFPKPPHAGKMLIALKDVGFGYGNRSIFSGANLEINKGDKVAIVGANGAGKTTLLRVLAGQLEAREGERRVYELTRLGYFAQHAAETLDPKHTALEALDEVATNEWRPRLRSLLGQFLFSGDDVFKPCRVLSGGERQRVAIARLLLEPTNLILLDEPTHHLDLAGKDVLEDGLEQYPGAVVVVTHDRSLMARVATRVIEVNDGRVILYPGGYDDYESARMARLRNSSPGNGPQRSVADRPDDDDDVPEDDRPGIVNAGAVLAAVHHAPATRSEREAAREAEKKQKAAEKKRAAAVAKLEADIEAAEARLKDVEEEMADPSTYHDGARARELVITQRTLREQIEKLWEQLGREAEAP